ncbi:MAG: hypothetical protein KC421_00280 [Anaerolineales bacterium]|nr:hypothetical protein [Anaerolineales bacterium]
MAKNEILLNGALAQPFQPYRNDNKLVTARSWAPWWLEADDEAPNWQLRRPVFSTYTLDGRLTQQVSTPWGTHVAGLWQQVPSVAGNSYEFVVEAQAWSSEDSAPATQLEASEVNIQIGIDPTGGLDPSSPLIVWSDKMQPLCHWETLRVQAEAEAGIITLFLRSAPDLPKRQQTVFWRHAFLRPIGQHKRAMNIVGSGDTHIKLEPEHPQPGEPIVVRVSSTRTHEFINLMVKRPNQDATAVTFRGQTMDGDRHVWHYQFETDMDGLYEIRFVADAGARLLALRLLRVARDVQIVPSSSARMDYKRIYVLLPPTADESWLLAAARGSFDGRFTIGFSADDAGIGDFGARFVIAVNPHHWPEVLTASWFQQHYPGVKFTPVVANAPEDLEAWLHNWTGDL